MSVIVPTNKGGSDYGTVDQDVQSDTRGPWFETRQSIMAIESQKLHND